MAEKIGQLRVCGNVQGNFRLTWIIERFSSLDSKVGKSYNSETLVLENEYIHSCIYLYPGGNRVESEGYVCFVHRENTQREINVSCKISLLNNKNDILFYSGNVLRVAADGGYRTIERKSLLSQLMNDTLLVCVEVIHCKTAVKSGIDIDPRHRSDGISPSLGLAIDLRALWMSKENSDCVIAVGDEDIPVHSVILGARSKVFAAMFKHDMKEKDSRRVEVTDFEKDVINSMMEFIYSGSIDGLYFNRALELLRASDKYEVSDLKLYCSNYLLSFMNIDNVREILLNADICNADKLRANSMRFFCHFLWRMDLSDERSVFETRPRLLFDIVQELNLQKQIERIETILDQDIWPGY